jgi:hypothetical protein
VKIAARPGQHSGVVPTASVKRVPPALMLPPSSAPFWNHLTVLGIASIVPSLRWSSVRMMITFGLRSGAALSGGAESGPSNSAATSPVVARHGLAAARWKSRASSSTNCGSPSVCAYSAKPRVLEGPTMPAFALKDVSWLVAYRQLFHTWLNDGTFPALNEEPRFQRESECEITLPWIAFDSDASVESPASTTPSPLPLMMLRHTNEDRLSVSRRTPRSTLS